MLRRSPLAVSVLIALAPLGACKSEPDLRVSGEHVIVASDNPEIPICAGNLADYDAEIERIDATYELTVDGKTELDALIAYLQGLGIDNEPPVKAAGTATTAAPTAGGAR